MRYRNIKRKKCNSIGRYFVYLTLHTERMESVIVEILNIYLGILSSFKFQYLNHPLRSFVRVIMGNRSYRKVLNMSRVLLQLLQTQIIKGTYRKFRYEEYLLIEIVGINFKVNSPQYLSPISLIYIRYLRTNISNIF